MGLLKRGELVVSTDADNFEQTVQKQLEAYPIKKRESKIFRKPKGVFGILERSKNTSQMC
jgi:hypothetical protein